MKSQLTITFRDRSILDLYAYYNSILFILNKIELDNCSEELKENLKVIYELLSHLQLEENLSEEES